MTCNPSTLLRAASAFRFLPRSELNAAKISVLCQWANAAQGPVPVVVYDSWWELCPSVVNLRNNFNGVVGARFTVNQEVQVGKLGRQYFTIAAQNHTVRLWISTDTVTPLASGLVLASSTADACGVRWVDVTPVTLSPGNTYSISVDEYDTGDNWKELWNPSAIPARINTAIFNVTMACSQPVVGPYPTVLGVYPASDAPVLQMYSVPSLAYVTV